MTAPPPAAAGAEAPEWRRLLDEGRRLFADDADYAEALDRFQRSYRLSPNWQAVNGIALVHQQQGLYVEAFAAYERLLEEFEAVLSDEQATRVERRLVWLRARLGTLEIAAPQPGVHVFVDGAEVGAGPLRRPVRVMPGAHRLLATRPGHEPMTRTLDVAAGGSVTVEIDLQPVMVRVETTHLERPMKVWIPWTVAGAGVAAIGIGVLVRLDASADYDRYRDLQRQEWEGDQRPVDLDDSALLDRADRKNAVAISLFATGGAAVITGLALAVFNQPRTRIETRRVPQVVPSPSGAALRFSF
jgi:tetratricopeptide (TPR) repeat protein